MEREAESVMGPRGKMVHTENRRVLERREVEKRTSVHLSSYWMGWERNGPRDSGLNWSHLAGDPPPPLNQRRSRIPCDPRCPHPLSGS